MIDELIRKPVRKNLVYGKMLTEIRQGILSGKLPPKSRILSEPELCERYGISRVSVRTALAKLEKDGLIVKKNGRGSFVCDSSDPAFSPQREICDIAVNLTNVNLNVSWYYTRIYKAAAAMAPHCNAKLSIVDRISAEVISPALWQGLIAISTDCNRELEKIAESGVRVVLFNRISPHPGIASVYVDYHEESYRAVRTLLERGHKQIALIIPDDGHTSTVTRVSGYLKAVNRSFPDPELFCPLEAERPEKECAKILAYLKEHRPDAVYIPFGAHFLPFITAVNQLKIRIPEDMEVLTFDDVSDMRSFCGFPFGYVKMPLADMAGDAVKYLSGSVGQDSVPVLRKRYPASIEYTD